MIASIVTYNPDTIRLKENIHSLLENVDRIIIVDNASYNIKEIKKTVNEYKNICLMINEKNEGVAYALNEAARYAINQNESWLLTMDQDSILNKGLLDCYNNILINHTDVKIGMLTCCITDRNFCYENHSINTELEEVETCITSGAFMNLESWKEVGGFDNKMFIDKVDSDYCLLLRECGYKILKCNYDGILHEIGYNTKLIKILNKNVIVFNHSPFRCYYIIRNQVYYYRKHKKSLRRPLRTYMAAYTRLLVILFWEKEKIRKIRTGIKGLVDGHFMQIE